MSLLANITKKITGGTIEKVGNTIDNLVTSDEERMKLKNELVKIIQENNTKVANFQRDVLVSETAGNTLQRSWRPILALSFGFIIISTYFFFPIINIWAKDADLKHLMEDLKENEGFWTLMELMIGGYVISRGVEKVASRVDFSFGRKRKDVDK